MKDLDKYTRLETKKLPYAKGECPGTVIFRKGKNIVVSLDSYPDHIYAIEKVKDEFREGSGVIITLVHGPHGTLVKNLTLDHMRGLKVFKEHDNNSLKDEQDRRAVEYAPRFKTLQSRLTQTSGWVQGMVTFNSPAILYVLPRKLPFDINPELPKSCIWYKNALPRGDEFFSVTLKTELKPGAPVMCKLELGCTLRLVCKDRRVFLNRTLQVTDIKEITT